MNEFDIASGDSSRLDGVIKLSHSRRQRSREGKGLRVEFRSMEPHFSHPTPSIELETSGIYVVPDGMAYDSLFVEHKNELLCEHDTIPEYVAALIANGTIDLIQQKANRTHHTSLNDPCIFINSTSHLVYGHWLLDIWPRYFCAIMALGRYIKNYKILLPIDSPDYAIAVLKDVFSVTEEQIIRFNTTTDIVHCKTMIVPSLLHNGYILHPDYRIFTEEIKKFYGIQGSLNNRKIYVSRKNYRHKSSSTGRAIANEAEIEDIFKSRGYEIASPELLSFKQQVALFDEAFMIAGESGSALHNALFSDVGTVTVSLSNINDVQEKICTFKGQHLIVVQPSTIETIDGIQIQNYDIPILQRALDLAEEKSGAKIA